MQACVSDSKLIRLAAGELTPAEREQVMSHLQSCLKCRDAWTELRATWELLGQADATPPRNDLTARVLKEAALLRGKDARWASAGRVAATIVLAAGLGIIAGVLTPSRPQDAHGAAPVSDEQIVEAVGLDALDAGTDLLTAVFEADDTEPGLAQERPS